MFHNYSLLCLFGISIYFLAYAVADEAIINGTRVVHTNQFRYQVSVQFHGHSHVCGGGIIDDRFVLTAAHCVLNRNRRLRDKHLSVLTGTKNLRRSSPSAVIARVETVFFPSEYNATLKLNLGDIAVLKLVDSLYVEHHLHLRKLQLSRNYQLDDDDIGIIAGFGWDRYYKIGKDRFGFGTTDGRLRFTIVTVLPNDECESDYREAFQSDKHLCASTNLFYEGTSACTGDSGSPLVSMHGNVIIGILSKIPTHCDEKEEPAVYTRVEHYLKIILHVMDHGHHPDMISLHT